MLLRRALVPLLLSGCAASAEYLCPPPVGVIIRDDCEVFRVRYESLRVKLRMGVGVTHVEGDFRREALRDPSELIQLMGHRMTALCHDFNTCRLDRVEYQRRRDEMDRTMTAIYALGEEMRRPGLEPRERQQLLERLLHLLDKSPRRKPRQPGRTEPEPPLAPTDRPKRRQKFAYFPTEPWFDSLFRPPVAPPAREGIPRLIAPWANSVLDIAWVPRSPDRPHDKKIGGYRPRIYVRLWGRVEADDQLEVSFQDGAKFRFPVAKNADGVSHVPCRLPKSFALTGRSFRYDVAYRKAMTDDWTRIGSIAHNVTEGIEGGYNFDHDREMNEGWLAFFPEPRSLPPDFERPHLFVTLRLRKHKKATARCWVGDEVVTDGMASARGSGQTGSVQDRPRYEEVSPNSSRQVAEPFIQWWRYAFAIPFVVPRGEGTPPKRLLRWPGKAVGDWRCEVKVDGVPVRDVRFTVQGDGKLDALSGQAGRAGDLVHPWWRVKTTVVPNTVEATREPPNPGKAGARR